MRCMYVLHSLHGQFSGFRFLIFLLKALIVVNFFISRGTMFQTRMDFASRKHYFVFPKSHLLLFQTSFSLLQTSLERVPGDLLHELKLLSLTKRSSKNELLSLYKIHSKMNYILYTIPYIQYVNNFHADDLFCY